MNIVKLSNSFLAIATQMGLTYHCGTASDVERNVVNAQGQALNNPYGQTGNLYPKLNFVYPDSTITAINDNRIAYNCLLYFTDLLNVDNMGIPKTELHTETLSNLHDKAVSFFDTVQYQLIPFLAQSGKIGDIIDVQNIKLESITYATKDVTAMVRATFTVNTYYECNGFVFNPSLLDLDTPYPVTGDYDYEDTNNK